MPGWSVDANELNTSDLCPVEEGKEDVEEMKWIVEYDSLPSHLFSLVLLLIALGWDHHQHIKKTKETRHEDDGDGNVKNIMDSFSSVIYVVIKYKKT